MSNREVQDKEAGTQRETQKAAGKFARAGSHSLGDPVSTTKRGEGRLQVGGIPTLAWRACASCSVHVFVHHEDKSTSKCKYVMALCRVFVWRRTRAGQKTHDGRCSQHSRCTHHSRCSHHSKCTGVVWAAFTQTGTEHDYHHPIRITKWPAARARTLRFPNLLVRSAVSSFLMRSLLWRSKCQGNFILPSKIFW